MSGQEVQEGVRGFSRLFAIETMRRIPHVMERETRHAIMRTTHEGRLFPQALSDVFGRVPEASRIELALHRMDDHFSSEVLALPDTQRPDEPLLAIRIVHEQHPQFDHTFLLHLKDLCQIHASGWHCFHAHETAMELLRLYYRERAIREQ
jgi:hypothetical protein